MKNDREHAASKRLPRRLSIIYRGTLMLAAAGILYPFLGFTEVPVVWKTINSIQIILYVGVLFAYIWNWRRTRQRDLATEVLAFAIFFEIIFIALIVWSGPSGMSW